MIGTALLLLGNGLLGTLIVLRGSLEGYGDQTLGLMGSAYFIGFFIGTYVVPPLIRRMGHIRAFNFFAAGIAAIVLVHSLVVLPWVWLILRLLTGIALVGFYTVIESWLNTQSQPERRGQIFAFYMVVNLGALAVAQQFLHFASPATFVLFSIAATMICLSVLPVAATRLPQPLVSTVPRLTVRRLWQAAPAAVVGAVVSGLAMGTFWSMGPLYGNRLGLDAGGVALLMTATIVGGALLQWPLGHFSDRGDRRHALAVSAGGATVAAILMAVFGEIEYALLAAAFLYGGMAFAIYPIVVAHLVDHLAQDDILSGNAGVLMLHGIGAVAGPTVAGLMMSIGGAAGLPVFFAIVLGPLAVYVALRARRVKDRIVEEPAHFVPMVRTSATAMEIAAAVEEHRLETAAEAAAEVAAAEAGPTDGTATGSLADEDTTTAASTPPSPTLPSEDGTTTTGPTSTPAAHAAEAPPEDAELSELRASEAAAEAAWPTLADEPLMGESEAQVFPLAGTQPGLQSDSSAETPDDDSTPPPGEDLRAAGPQSAERPGIAPPEDDAKPRRHE